MSYFTLKYLELKLAFGEFGKQKKYQRLCLERNATTTAARLEIAKEVLDGPGVNSLESWAHDTYLKEHAKKETT
jgi:hypothetical protein